MTKNRMQITGEMRRSAVISTFGPGAIVDMRSGAATLSGVHCGLEEWDASAPLDGEIEAQRIYERRLQRRLSVDYFRLPPVFKTEYASGQLVAGGGLVLRRFPNWLQCPKCGGLKKSQDWNCDAGRPERYCGGCSPARNRQQRVYVIPTRFIAACTAGHLGDFPWVEWVTHANGCAKTGNLSLTSVGAGLAGLKVTCKDCQQDATLKSAFTKTAFARFKCPGERPWLRENDPNGCINTGLDGSFRALQRGASNVYYPVIESALDIPPWSSRVVRLLQDFWDDLADRNDTQDRIEFIRGIRILRERIERSGIGIEQCVSEFEAVQKAGQAGEQESMKIEEYRIFESNLPREDLEFQLVVETVPHSFAKQISSLSRIPRLREVRAISGFTRINPPFDGSPSKMASISISRSGWLPASEIKGEGIYFGFNLDALGEWEELPAVTDRVEAIALAWSHNWEARNPGVPLPFSLTARKLLIHTTAHMLIKQLALESGYDSASIRERVFDESDANQAGVLLFTGSNDADGTLGGLQSAGLSDTFGELLRKALIGNRWCVSDPLCIHGDLSVPESFSIANCHGCIMLPESSCESFNHFLDRATAVGTPEHPEIGFFSKGLNWQ